MQRRIRCASLLWASCLFAPLAPGCGLTLDLDPADEAGVAEAGILDSSLLDGGPARDAGPADGGVDASRVGECTIAADCDALYGAAPCGAWACGARGCEVHCPDCVDLDLDGYGVGMGCGGRDCNDADDAIGSAAARACYGGPSGTEGVGICMPGIEECVGGVWLPCAGEIIPTFERCDGRDEDCDGAVDDLMLVTSCGLGTCATTSTGCSGIGPLRCVPPGPVSTIDACGGGDEDCDGTTDEDCGVCTWVSLGGDDRSSNPTSVISPFRTVQVALDWAAADRGARPQRVCLMSAACGGGGVTATYNEGITMRAGVALLGSYDSGGRPCPSRTTAIRNMGARGVLFDDTIRTQTELARVVIYPIRDMTRTVAGITVDGSIGAIINDVRVDRTELALTSVGIDVLGGAAARVSRSEVYSGRAIMEAVGLRSVESRVELLDNCDRFDGLGRCITGCRFSGGAGFHGHFDASMTPTRAARSFAVQLIDSPGSLVRSSATCGQQALRGAGIRVEGAAAGTRISGNHIAGFGPSTESYGIEMMACGDASPLIDSNFDITAEAPPGAIHAAIRVHADCHPIIALNTRIAAGLEGVGNGVAIHCGDVGGTSRCSILGNLDIRGSSAGVPTSATGVRCEFGSCARIEDNIIEGGPSSGSSVGLSLEGGGGGPGTIVDRNTITGGCAGTSAIALQAVMASATITNTILDGGSCPGGVSVSSTFRGLVIVPPRAPLRFVVHSSTILAGGANGSCDGRAIEIAPALGAAVPVGLFRNLVLVPGPCLNAYGMFEAGPSSDPQAFEHVLIVPFSASGSAPVLYRDEGTVALTSAASIEALTDMSVARILAAPAGFRSPTDLHLVSGSACIGAGSTAGVPPVDRDGVARMPGRPDLGAYAGP